MVQLFAQFLQQPHAQCKSVAQVVTSIHSPVVTTKKIIEVSQKLHLKNLFNLALSENIKEYGHCNKVRSRKWGSICLSPFNPALHCENTLVRFFFSLYIYANVWIFFPLTKMVPTLHIVQQVPSLNASYTPVPATWPPRMDMPTLQFLYLQTLTLLPIFIITNDAMKKSLPGIV